MVESALTTTKLPKDDRSSDTLGAILLNPVRAVMPDSFLSCQKRTYMQVGSIKHQKSFPWNLKPAMTRTHMT